jgi:hypothetical protein
LSKYPNQRDFVTLPLLRDIYEFKFQLRVMILTLQLARRLEIPRDEIYTALDAYNPPPPGKASQIQCLFDMISRHKEFMTGANASEVSKATDYSSFVTIYHNSLKQKLFEGFKQFHTQMGGGNYTESSRSQPLFQTPAFMDMRERALLESNVARFFKLQKGTELIQEVSVHDTDGGFSIALHVPGIITEVSEEPETNDLLNKVSNKLFSFTIEEEDSRGTDASILRAPTFNERMLSRQTTGPIEIILPDFVCKKIYKVEYQFFDTAETLYGKTTGNINFKDIEGLLVKVLGCKISEADGIGAFFSHPEYHWRFYVPTPHPELNYKTYDLDRIKCILEDYFGVFFDNFSNSN